MRRSTEQERPENGDEGETHGRGTPWRGAAEEGEEECGASERRGRLRALFLSAECLQNLQGKTEKGAQFIPAAQSAKSAK
jgi:hypothetical protein